MGRDMTDDVRERIQSAREELNWPLSKTAEELGITRKVLESWLYETRRDPPVYALLAAKYLELRMRSSTPPAIRSISEAHDELKKKVIAMYGAGETYATISSETGYAVSSIVKQLRAEGIARNRLRKSVSTGMRDKIVRMYEDGLIITEVAEKAGCSKHTVRRILSKARVLRGRGRPRRQHSGPQ